MWDTSWPVYTALDSSLAFIQLGELRYRKKESSSRSWYKALMIFFTCSSMVLRMPRREIKYWLWVMRPKYFDQVEPATSWSCHKDTKKGDLIFIWRAKKNHDIAYLVQAESDSVPHANWNYSCKYKILYKFKNPINIKDLKANDTFFQGWKAYSGNFQGSSFIIPPNYWEALNEIALKKDSEYNEFLYRSDMNYKQYKLDAVPESDYPFDKLVEDTGLDRAALIGYLQAIQRKGQAIIYGPPGTGKTFMAEHLARHLVGVGGGFRELVQFHPAYEYEDFIQGIRPHTRQDGTLEYSVVPGRFYEFCMKAQGKDGICVFIIDEINRANLSRVFGELMYLLEYREREIRLPADGRPFKIPENVRIIGTMNTADRSIALVDYALRRRFAFLELRPDYDVLRRYHAKADTDFPVERLIQVLTNLNKEINDPRSELGISYFLCKELETEMGSIWKMEIEPYLNEYFFDNRDTADKFHWESIKPTLGL